MIPPESAGEPCPLCGAPHATCGPGSSAVPVDLLTTIPRGDPVLKKYRTTVNGVATTLKLSAEDVKTWQGDTLTEVTSDPQPVEQPVEDEKARKPAANKARTASENKS